MNKFREVLKKIPLFVKFIRLGRKLYRLIRTNFLLFKAPEGDYLMCNGIKVFCNFNDETYSWYDGNSPNLLLDQKVIATLFKHCKGNVFLDIGAHFGFFTAYFSKLLQGNLRNDSILISLEPDKDHFKSLQKTMVQFDGLKIILLPLAISSDDGDLTLYKTNASCLHTYLEEGAESMYRIPAISLDTLILKYLQPEDKIALIKIDVDGAEPSLFAGGKAALSKHNPLIFMEFSPVHIRASGVEPKLFFEDICQRYIVYWVCYQRKNVRRVNLTDYDEIASLTGKGVTDLVLSDNELLFEHTLE